MKFLKSGEENCKRGFYCEIKFYTKVNKKTVQIHTVKCEEKKCRDKRASFLLPVITRWGDNQQRHPSINLNQTDVSLK